MGNRLQGRNAVVTGGGRGIGREIALALGAEGAKVVVNGVTTKPEEGHQLPPAEDTATEIKKAGGTAIASFENAGDFAAAERLIKACVDAFGSIDILVNSQGVLRDRMLHNMSEQEWDEVINVHLKGTFNTCRHALPYMRKQSWGRIILPSSAAWLGASPGQANYSAAKGAINSLTRVIALENGRMGITCNCLVPMAATRMTLNEAVKANFRRQYEEGKITKQVLEDRLNMPGPEFIAPIVVYLCTDAAANINGLSWRAAGGTVGIYSEPALVKTIHKDHRKGEKWTIEELEELVPKFLLLNYVNPAPPAPPGQEKK
jgi:NAD(P)-dependent dehydrogenase (short-subunit alcohol dehydrogenase family)